jgi:hypothetical protein
MSRQPTAKCCGAVNFEQPARPALATISPAVFSTTLTPRDLWSVGIMHYREVMRTRQPLFAPVSIANGRRYNEVSKLLLSLANDDDAVAFGR